METNVQLEVATTLLTTSKRNLQLLDEYLNALRGRDPVSLADDVASEHKAAWLGAVSDEDGSTGVYLGQINQLQGSPTYPDNFGWDNKKTGKIRNQEDAAFVCTNILLAIRVSDATDVSVPETVGFPLNTNLAGILPFLRLSDGNTGRNLIVGSTSGTLATGQTDSTVEQDRGAVPFSALSSIRPGFGADIKNKLFSEFTIPRSGVVNVEVYNLFHSTSAPVERYGRAYVTLLGYKVFGA
jgi:hypothetical protein